MDEQNKLVPATNKPKCITFGIGDIHELNGFKFRISYVNIGKQRITLEPVQYEDAPVIEETSASVNSEEQQVV